MDSITSVANYSSHVIAQYQHIQWPRKWNTRNNNQNNKRVLRASKKTTARKKPQSEELQDIHLITNSAELNFP